MKVLDFGLAKSTEEPAAAGSPESSPTLTLEQATRTGTVVGTAAYMAPEQARGKPVDKRAGIWAFGVILYEMVTGERMFKGETVSDTLAAVLTKEPEWARVPPRVERLLSHYRARGRFTRREGSRLAASARAPRIAFPQRFEPPQKRFGFSAAFSHRPVGGGLAVSVFPVHLSTLLNQQADGVYVPSVCRPMQRACANIIRPVDIRAQFNQCSNGLGVSLHRRAAQRTVAQFLVGIIDVRSLATRSRTALVLPLPACASSSSPSSSMCCPSVGLRVATLPR